MNNYFWEGFEKQAGLKDIFRVGKSAVNIGGPVKPIGSSYIENIKKEVPKIKDIVKKNPAPSMVDQPSRWADLKNTPRHAWQDALKTKA